eukprot:523559-Heterocapsa_arctica.AAC.1
MRQRHPGRTAQPGRQPGSRPAREPTEQPAREPVSRRARQAAGQPLAATLLLAAVRSSHH